MKKIFSVIIFCSCAMLAAHAQTDAYTDTAVVDTSSVSVDDEYDDEDGEYVEEPPRELVKPVLRSVSDDSIQAQKNRPAYAYMSYADSLLRNPDYVKEELEEPEEEGTNILDYIGVRTLYWIIAVSVVLWLLWAVLGSQGSLFARNRTKKPVADTIEEEATVGMPMELLAEKAIKAKDYRLAVRYLYLHTLELLGERQLILVAPQKTNYQYLAELRGKPFAPAFSKLTMQYEYVWYGAFSLTDEKFATVHAGFKQFKDNLKAT